MLRQCVNKCATDCFVVFCLGKVASAQTRNVFYVLGSDGIYIIDPVEKKIVKKITNTTSPGLCAKKDDRRARLASQICINCSYFLTDKFLTIFYI